MVYSHSSWLFFIAILNIVVSTEITIASPFITNPPQTDGFGSQFQSIISAAVYAELNNKQYVYSPFIGMEHNYHNDPNFLATKEEFINFIHNFEINKKEYNAATSTTYKSYFDAHIQECEKSFTLQKIKQIFRANKQIKNHVDNTHLTIAIHVRRANAHDSRIQGTNTSDHLYLSIINALRQQYAPNNPLFHLYSQGDREHFTAYLASDTQLHLNESIESTFLDMVLADILVIGTSSFSYTAGLLSNGVIYYIPFWHSPLSHWISVYTLL